MCQEPSFERCRPKFYDSQLLLSAGRSYRGLDGRNCLFLRDIIRYSVLFELNDTSQVSALYKILTKLALRRSAEEIGSSSIINRLVSSANQLIQEPLSFTMVFIKIHREKDHV